MRTCIPTIGAPTLSTLSAVVTSRSIPSHHRAPRRNAGQPCAVCLRSVYRRPCVDHEGLCNLAEMWLVGGGRYHPKTRKRISSPTDMLPSAQGSRRGYAILCTGTYCCSVSTQACARVRSCRYRDRIGSRRGPVPGRGDEERGAAGTDRHAAARRNARAVPGPLRPNACGPRCSCRCQARRAVSRSFGVITATSRKLAASSFGSMACTTRSSPWLNVNSCCRLAD